MRDLHSHYLPGVDDGAKTLENTICMLKNARKHGVTDILFTPHYIKDSKFTSDASSNMEKFKKVKEIAKKAYGMNVFLGNEVYFTQGLLELYKEKKIRTLNDSRYLLIEIPLYQAINITYLKSEFFDLLNAGIIPILAHPERYESYYKDFEFFESLRNIGVLFQVNYPSLVGTYGTKAKKMAKYLLKRGLISFVGSDIHSVKEEKYEILPKVEKKIKKYIGEEKFIEITENNFARVVKNEKIL